MRNIFILIISFSVMSVHCISLHSCMNKCEIVYGENVFSQLINNICYCSRRLDTHILHNNTYSCKEFCTEFYDKPCEGFSNYNYNSNDTMQVYCICSEYLKCSKSLCRKYCKYTNHSRKLISSCYDGYECKCNLK